MSNTLKMYFWRSLDTILIQIMFYALLTSGKNLLNFIGNIKHQGLIFGYLVTFTEVFTTMEH